MFSNPALRQPRRIFLVLSILVLAIVVPAAIAEAIVPESPRRDLPIVLDGEVWDVEQVGGTVVVAGNFTQVQTTRDGPIVNQAAIYAYDADSGLFIDDFRPILISNNSLAEVRDLEASPDGRSVYIGGRFTAINDQSDGQVRVRNRLALLDVADGRLDRNFAQAGVDAKVLSIELSNGRLYAGGNFLNVIDTAPGRPPINRPVRGLARFDAATGLYDTSFRFESQNDIGRRQGDGTYIYGVTRIDMNPAGTRLVVAHRGATMVNVNTGNSVNAGGVAIIAIAGDQTGSITGFRALYPDPADPIQEFFHAGQCNGIGTQIRDMEVSPDGRYFALTSQGADRGYQCDTITRFELVDSPVRPTWVSRAFDSVFSIGIDDDAVYVGGHFRYLVSPNAPSPFPGDNGPNGVLTPRGQWYSADENDQSLAGQEFRTDLLEPGYVFRARQVGALDPNTGFGIQSWEPGSDAAKGVLALTVTDRGLLLGQDNGRVNDQFVGRAAFFDENPNAGDPRCQVSLNADGRPVVSWTDIGSVQEWRVAANGSFIGATAATSLVDGVTAPGETVAYELRFNRNGIAQTDDCGSVVIPVLSINCSVRAVGDQVEISWNDENWTRVAVRRDGSFLATVKDGLTTYVDNPGPGTWTYQARGVAAVTVEADCGSITIDAPPPPVAPDIDCTATVVGDTVRLSWNDEDWSRVTVRRDGGWLATVSNVLTYTDDPAPGTYTYSLRGIKDGERSETNCSPVTISAAQLSCSINRFGGDANLSWNDVGAKSYQVRLNNSWVTSLDAGTTSYSETDNGGDYAIRFRLDGVRTTIPCN